MILPILVLFNFVKTSLSNRNSFNFFSGSCKSFGKTMCCVQLLRRTGLQGERMSLHHAIHPLPFIAVVQLSQYVACLYYQNALCAFFLFTKFFYFYLLYGLGNFRSFATLKNYLTSICREHCKLLMFQGGFQMSFQNFKNFFDVETTSEIVVRGSVIL